VTKNRPTTSEAEPKRRKTTVAGKSSSEPTTMTRKAKIERATNETKISLSLHLDGEGKHQNATGVGFFDHMLDLFARHGAFDLSVAAEGDLHVDQHHTVEDVGICLGRAFKEALGDKRAIRRYGHFSLPMEDALANVAIDFSGRPFLVFQVDFTASKIGDFDSELVEEFWQAFMNNAGCNLHITVPYGRNSHHISEAIFKATARAARMAVETDDRMTGVPSTKGLL
jgi:imidazoleglycerol-phosphate dehydratase